MKKKLILTLLSIVLLLTMGVMSTLAFLTDRDKVVNVFTVGDVQIKVIGGYSGEEKEMLFAEMR